MLSYNEFKKIVLERYKGEEWQHILPGVPPVYRMRFINILDKGVDMPTAFDLVLVTKHMSDKDFRAKLEEVSST